MGDFGLLGPGDEVFAPKKGGETGGQVRGEAGSGADEIEPAQFGGEIGQKGRHSVAVAGFQGGLGVGADEVELGVGDLAGQSLMGAENLEQGLVGVFNGGGVGGGSGRGNGEKDFFDGRARARAAIFLAGEVGEGMPREFGAGIEGAKKVAVAVAELGAELFEGRGSHHENTTVRFL